MQSLHKCKIMLLTYVQILVDNDSYVGTWLAKNLAVYVAAAFRNTDTCDLRAPEITTSC